MKVQGVVDSSQPKRPIIVDSSGDYTLGTAGRPVPKLWVYWGNPAIRE